MPHHQAFLQAFDAVVLGDGSFAFVHALVDELLRLPHTPVPLSAASKAAGGIGGAGPAQQGQGQGLAQGIRSRLGSLLGAAPSTGPGSGLGSSAGARVPPGQQPAPGGQYPLGSMPPPAGPGPRTPQYPQQQYPQQQYPQQPQQQQQPPKTYLDYTSEY